MKLACALLVGLVCVGSSLGDGLKCSCDQINFVEREDWGGVAPSKDLWKLKHPVERVIISHTASSYCFDKYECSLQVRLVQVFHTEVRGYHDIAYNFLVGGDSQIYVGRGWENAGAHAKGYNNGSIGISFIGTFNEIEPQCCQLEAAQRLIELGVAAGKLAEDYKLLGHRQVSATLSPGDALYAIIKTWPHWSPTP